MARMRKKRKEKKKVIPHPKVIAQAIKEPKARRKDPPLEEIARLKEEIFQDRLKAMRS